LWSSFGNSLSRSLEEQQLQTEALKNRSFGEQLWVLSLEHNFGGNFRQQLCGAAFGSRFAE